MTLHDNPAQKTGATCEETEWWVWKLWESRYLFAKKAWNTTRTQKHCYFARWDLRPHLQSPRGYNRYNVVESFLGNLLKVTSITWNQGVLCIQSSTWGYVKHSFGHISKQNTVFPQRMLSKSTSQGGHLPQLGVWRECCQLTKNPLKSILKSENKTKATHTFHSSLASCWDGPKCP